MQKCQVKIFLLIADKTMPKQPPLFLPSKIKTPVKLFSLYRNT